MKVYVVREIYGSVAGVYESAEEAEKHIDRLYSYYNDVIDPEDWIVEEWEVE